MLAYKVLTAKDVSVTPGVKYSWDYFFSFEQKYSNDSASGYYLFYETIIGYLKNYGQNGLYETDYTMPKYSFVGRISGDTTNTTPIDQLNFTFKESAASDVPITTGALFGSFQYSTYYAYDRGTSDTKDDAAGPFYASDPLLNGKIYIDGIPRQVSVSINGATSVVEGDTGFRDVSYIVSLSEPATKNISISYKTSSASAKSGEDFIDNSGLITFLPGETSREIKISVIGDTIPEDNEIFSVSITDPVSSSSQKLVIDYANASVYTSIVDQIMPSTDGFVSLIGNIFGKRSEYFRPLAETIADVKNPAVKSQLDVIDNTIGKFGTLVGTTAPFVSAGIDLKQQLNTAANISRPLEREQSEWAAWRNFEISIYNEALKAGFVAGVTPYVLALAEPAAVAGGIEIFITAAAAAAGIPLSSATVVAAGAFIISNPLLLAVGTSAAAAIVYDQYFSDRAKDIIKKDFDAAHPVPTELTVPQSEIKILSRDGLDQKFYLKTYTDVALSGKDAEEHYDQYGWHEGRDPNAGFSTSGYLASNADVAKAGINPLKHYDTYGWKEGRDPGARFDNEFYLARNADVKAAGIDPLTHYLEYGQAEGRAIFDAVGKPADIKGGFDAEFYLLLNTDVARAAQGQNDTFAFARQHFDTYGWKEGRDPNAVFDTKGYLVAYGDVAAAGINPLSHYDTYGWKEGRDPSADFDSSEYLQVNGDVAQAGLNPMQHYLQYGLVENRAVLNDGTFGAGLIG